MERTKWSDERLDERMSAIDAKFDRIFAELHLIRVGMAEFRAELTRFQRHVTTIHAGLAIALVGVLGASQF